MKIADTLRRWILVTINCSHDALDRCALKPMVAVPGAITGSRPFSREATRHNLYRIAFHERSSRLLTHLRYATRRFFWVPAMRFRAAALIRRLVRLAGAVAVGRAAVA